MLLLAFGLMASNLLMESIQDSLKQLISSIISETISSHVQSLIPELMRSLQSTNMASAGQRLETPSHTPTLQLDSEPLHFPPAEKDASHVCGATDFPTPNGLQNPILANAVPLESQVQQRQEKGSYRQVLLPTTQECTDQLAGIDREADDSSSMKAQRKGDYLSVKIDDALVQREATILQNSLIGKISLAVGDSPYSLEDLYSKLSQI